MVTSTLSSLITHPLHFHRLGEAGFSRNELPGLAAPKVNVGSRV